MLTLLIAIVGLSAFPVENGETALGDEWLKTPLAGIVTRSTARCPTGSATSCACTSV